MAVRTKNRRKIGVGQRNFVWYVVQDDDSVDIVLHVMSEDKKFIINYHLNQPEQSRFLTILGSEFLGLSDIGGRWVRVLCPQWEDNSIISPSSVHRLIDWCLIQERQLIRVDYMGKPITD